MTRLPLKKRMGEIVEDTTRVTMLDRDAVMCQYLMAERFVKSILEYRHETWEDVYGVADVIMKRLTSLDGYADAKNGDRATQQLRLLANVVARWITEILAEVAKTRKEALKEYDKIRRMRRLEVEDVNQTTKKQINEMYSEAEIWEQMDQIEEEVQVNVEEKNYDNEFVLFQEQPNEREKKEQKGDKSNKEEDKTKKEEARKREQLDDSEAKSESVTEETVEKE